MEVTQLYVALLDQNNGNRLATEVTVLHIKVEMEQSADGGTQVELGGYPEKGYD